MRALALLFASVLALPFAAAGTDLCTPRDVGGVVVVRCERFTYWNGDTRRETEVEVMADHDAPLVPAFVLRVSFEQHVGNGTAERCSVYYHRMGQGLGPTSLEWGTHCVYPFYLP